LEAACLELVEETMRRLVTIAFGALVLGLGACGAPPPAAEVAAGPEPTTAVQDIMNDLMARAMDEAFLLPDILTDADAAKSADPGDIEAAWARVKHGAITLTEIPNLVVVPGRRITRPGSEVTGASGGGYLHAAEIETRFRERRTDLLQAARNMHQAGLTAQAAAARRDVKALQDLSIDIEVVCEGCHTQFWYSSTPTEPPAR